MFSVLAAVASPALSRRIDDPLFVEFLERRKESFLIIVRAARKIADLKTQLSNRNFPVFPGDVQRSSDSVKMIASILADAYASLAKAEQQVRSDRYLMSIFSSNLRIVHKEIMKLSERALEKGEDLVDFFLRNRNLCLLKDIIFEAYGLSNLRVLGRRDLEKVILFLIDGMGLVQFYWQANLIRDNCLATTPSQILVCGSSPIPETTAAMMTMFTGTGLKGHAIPCKFIYENGRFKEVNLTLADLKAITKATPFLEELFRKRVRIHAITQSERGTNSFEDFIFEGNAHRIRAKGERDAFYEAKALVTSLPVGVRDFVYVYVPFIDRRGHPIGPFTNFELYEFQILNLLFHDFIKGIATTRPDLLDKTLIIVAADHGMYEVSSGTRVSLDDLISILEPRNVALNGRCCLIECSPGREHELLEAIEDKLSSLAITKDTYNVIQKKDVDYFGSPGDLCYDRMAKILLQFSGAAQFVPSHVKNKRLLFLGNHGGRSIEEMLVPILCIPVSSQTIEKVDEIYREPPASGGL